MNNYKLILLCFLGFVAPLGLSADEESKVREALHRAMASHDGDKVDELSRKHDGLSPASHASTVEEAIENAARAGSFEKVDDLVLAATSDWEGMALSSAVNIVVLVYGYGVFEHLTTNTRRRIWTTLGPAFARMKAVSYGEEARFADIRIEMAQAVYDVFESQKTAFGGIDIIRDILVKLAADVKGEVRDSDDRLAPNTNKPSDHVVAIANQGRQLILAMAIFSGKGIDWAALTGKSFCESQFYL